MGTYFLDKVRGLLPQAAPDEEGQTVVRSFLGGVGPWVWIKKRGWLQPSIDVTGNIGASTEINRMLAVRDGGCVELPEGSPLIDAPLVMPRNGTTLIGRSNFATQLKLSGAVGQNWITSSNTLGIRIENLLLQRTAMQSATPTGYAIKLTNCFGARIGKLWTEQCENGIWLDHCTDTIIRDFKPRNGFGNRAILIGSASAWGNQTYIYDVRSEAGGPPLGYPAAFSTGMPKDWVANEASVPVGALRVVAGVLLWQCTTTGNAGSTNGSLVNLPSTDPTLARSTAVTNGTAQWKYVGRADYYALCLDSYGGDLFAENVVGLNGGGTFQMIDSLAPGNASHIVRLNRFVADHVLDYGAIINAGSDIWLNGEFQAIRTHGVVIGAGVYDWHIRNSKMLGSGQNGIFANSGNGSIEGCDVGHNSQLTTNTYDGMVVAGDDNVITGNKAGNIWDGSTACPQRYGLNYASGAHYVIVGNWFRGNTTGTFVHPSGTGAQVANNVIA